MKIKLNPKVIKEMCGVVSFKRGEAFYRANRIKMLEYTEESFKAVVEGKEDAHVQIEVDHNGAIQASCSCLSLASYQKDCQHVAAVLISIYNREQQRLAEGFMTIFDEQPSRPSRQQVYLEDRETIEVEFKLKINTEKNKAKLFGIELQVGNTPILEIHEFLGDMKKRRKSNLSPSLIFDPAIHCFTREADEAIQQMVQLRTDEKFLAEPVDFLNRKDTLLIPPSAWGNLLPLLLNAQKVKLEYGERTFPSLRVTRDPLPIQFELGKKDGNGYYLSIKRLSNMIVLPLYDCVIDNGTIIHLDNADCQRLESLKEMLDATNTNQIPIGNEQIHFFMEKILPGLKKLGDVKISESISANLLKEPLVAKLYLDRVKNRLLAGLEFHYGKLVLNPLEEDQMVGRALLVRDHLKEKEILQIMEDSEFGKTDGGYFLHNEELEYEFLYHVMPRLQKLVQIYATTAVRNRIIKSTAPPNIKVKMKKERTNWLEFKFEMNGISEQEIRDLLGALEEKRKYYRLKNGSLLSLEAREFEEIKRFLQAVPIQEDEDLVKGLEMPLLRGISFLDSILDHEAFAPEESFHLFLQQLSNPGSLPFEIPKKLEPILRDYQKSGYHWLKTLASYGFGGILADDMGLGKTLQSITYIESVLTEIQEKKLPVLIVCPSSVTYNWLSEFMKFTPYIQATVLDGTKKERTRIQQELEKYDVIITSYTLLRKDIIWFEQKLFHTVFFDEAQAFKNPITQTARTVKKIQADHRFALTGTPVENSIEELWSIFHVVFPELFRGLKNYANLTRKQIARRSRPFLLRRMKEDVLTEFPEKIELQESVELLPEQKKLYAAYLAKLRHDTLKHLDKDTIRKNRIKILAGLTRLRQICCHPVLFVDGYQGSSAKLDKLLQIIEESKLANRRVLIFSQFTKMLQLIGRQLALRGLPFFYLDGQTPSEERVEICERFNRGENDFFLISLKAGGTGLNLTGADTVILYDIWWNPAVEEQASDRAHRIGQKNNVKVIKLLTRGTIEEKMDELQEKKRHLIEEIIDSKDNSTSKLTEDDIRELLMLDED